MRRFTMLRTSILLLAVAALLIHLTAEFLFADDAAALSEIIDRHTQSRLDAEGLKRVPQSDDAEFLRRVFLDLHGVVPSADQVATFLDSDDLQKRSKLVDELLASPRFGEHFGDL